VRAVVGSQRDDLAVDDQPLRTESPHLLDDLGQPVGDVVEGPRDDQHVGPVLVRLDPDAVKLDVGDDPATVRSQLVQAGVDVGGAGSEHGQHRTADLQRCRTQPVGPGVHRHPGRRRRRAEEHGSPAQQGRRDAQGGRQGFQHQGVQRALAHLTEEQPAQQVLLLGGRPA